MSIVRIGLAETKHFAEGYDAIFGARHKAPATKKRKASTNRNAKKKTKGKKR